MKRRKGGQVLRYLLTYRFRSIYIHNFLGIVVLVNLPVLLLVLLYASHLKNTADENLKKANLETLKRSASVVDKVFNELESFTYMLSVDHNVKMFVFLDSDRLSETQYVADIVQSLRIYTGTFEYVESVYLYSGDNQMVIIENGLRPLSSVLDQSWLPAYEQMTGSTFTIDARLKNDYYPYYITMLYPIKNSRKKEGAVVVNVNVEKMARLADSAGGNVLYLISDTGRMYYASDVRELENGGVASFAVGLPATDEGDVRVIDTENGPCYMSYIRSREFDWNYILLTPVSSYGDGKSDILLLQIAAGSLLLTFIVSFILTKLTYTPVGELLHSLEEVSGSEISYIDARNKSEVAYIRSVVTTMHDRNDFLESELESRMKALSDTQLVMLQNQINPHFIYNTLDTINWTALEKLGADNDVSEMITTLAALLRTSLSRESYLVSVAEETDHARLYLALIERRYRDRLRVYWDVDERTADCKMLKLSLQPLIENALNHGLRARRYNGTIRIRITAENGELLHIAVEDDGAGLDDAAFALLDGQLRQDAYTFDAAHVGIRNIQRRIRLLFGDAYGLTLEKPPQGFRVVMRCPIIR